MGPRAEQLIEPPDHLRGAPAKGEVGPDPTESRRRPGRMRRRLVEDLVRGAGGAVARAVGPGAGSQSGAASQASSVMAMTSPSATLTASLRARLSPLPSW